mmetsp:Transcript_85238/g.241523  ORF Transcript_85238/g.241523 Transcript_85238/m.241523 type:complete len:238 (-) Transcript_85238:58-771(-)
MPRLLRSSAALLLLLTASATTPPSDDVSCTPLTDLQQRMPTWVGSVPYSHLVNKSWSYPTDCSGFVSWALQLGRDAKAYEYASDALSTRIATDDLRYGDVITHVFDKTPLDRCSKMDLDDDGAADSAQGLPDEGVGIVGDLVGDLGHVSGHVFFFDKWDDEATKSSFWAYESTETQDQTEACLAQKGLLTRSACLNHYVLKSRDTPDKWRRENCSDPKYGSVSGGPRRLLPAILCPQ